MTQLLQRREVLQGIIGGMAVFAFAPTLHAASAAPVTALAANISLLNMGRVNVLLHVTERNVVMVDTGPNAYVAELAELILALSTSVDYTLFHTHWHSDQIGG